ncbi:MAG: hypothetical protein JO110_16020 [Acetobacteraceae bacterium]|nr:hypothetical protein [Acetobacteraceae bacterium]
MPVAVDPTGQQMVQVPSRIDFLLRSAAAVAVTMPATAADMVMRVMITTVDPRLLNLLSSALVASDAGDHIAAHRWVQRAIDYRDQRRAGR